MSAILPIQNNSVINTVTLNDKNVEFKCFPNTVQDAGSDWATAIDVRRGISLQDALDLAAANEEIDYFFIAKKDIWLNLPPGMPKPKDPLNLITKVKVWLGGNNHFTEQDARVFKKWDAVFFKKGDESFVPPNMSGFDNADLYQKQG